VDSFQLGYPRYSALLSTHPAFFVFRRFGRVRMRLLLLKQNEVLTLQEALDKLDEEETNRLSLSCFRRDSNRERQQILERLTKSLDEYGMLHWNQELLRDIIVDEQLWNLKISSSLKLTKLSTSPALAKEMSQV